MGVSEQWCGGAGLGREERRWGQGRRSRVSDTVPEERRHNERRAWAEVGGAGTDSVTWGFRVLVAEMGGWPGAPGALRVSGLGLERRPRAEGPPGEGEAKFSCRPADVLSGRGVVRRSWLL